MKLLEIKDLSVSVEGKTILEGLDLSVGKGEIHVLMGPNGAGKSTLASAIMGHPNYRVDGGSILLDGEDITRLPVNERAKRGIFLSFQNPEEVPGVTLESFMRASRAAVTGKPVRPLAYRKELREKMEEVGMDIGYASRYLNVGFSGGEKKKAEILQMLMLRPKLAILDETDSGLDVDAVRTISEGVRNYMTKDTALLIITHNAGILEQLSVDYVHILMDKNIVHTGDGSLVAEIGRSGFAPFAAAAR